MNDLTETLEVPGPLAAEVAVPLGLDEEAELVERARSEPDAFGQLYEAHYSAILNYLYRRTLSVSVAEELTSNTFFKAMRGLPEYRSRPGVRFRTWLYRIATNEAGMRWRSLAARGVTRDLQDDLARITFIWPRTESAEEARAKQERFALVHQALGRLPGLYRTALTLRYFEGLPLEEIGAVLDKPVGTIKSLVHRGLAKFAKEMADLEGRE